MIKLLKTLVNLDKSWIPTEPGYSLYVRPTMIGTQAGLGVGASSDALLFVIMSPVSLILSRSEVDGHLTRVVAG